MAPIRPDEWELLIPLIRSYSLRKYGQPPIGLTIHLPQGDSHREPIPLRYSEPLQSQGEMAKPSNWASGNEPKSLSDCQKVYWPPLGVFTFTPRQRLAVKVLWEAWLDGNPDVDQSALLAAAESDCTRLRDLFSRSPAWQSLIVQGCRPGSYRLADRGDPPEDDAA